MGLRFRKSFKLAPGIRMNLGSGGLSWSLGPRGCSIGVGKRGIYLNAGLPGTGLSYRTRLDAPVRSAAQNPVIANVQVTVEVTDDGQIYFKDQNGNPAPDLWVKQAKLQQGDKIRALIVGKCNAINEQVESLARLHLSTSFPNVQPKFVRQQFDVFEPVPPSLRPHGFMSKVAKRVSNRIDSENAARAADHEAALERYKEAKQMHDDAQTLLKQDFFSAVAGVPAAMERLLEKELGEIVWPRETLISLQISPNGDKVYLDIDLPEIEHMPRMIASVPQSGFRLNVKPMTETNLRKLYMQHVHAIGFRILGEVFAALPTVQQTVLSGYSQRTSASTGHVEIEYLYSVRVIRDDWCATNFSKLEVVDIVEAFTRFDLRRALSKTSVFAAIEPFEEPTLMTFS